MSGPDIVADDGTPITTDAEKIAYRNRFITVFDNAVTFPDGSAGTYLRIIEGDDDPGVVVLAMCGRTIALVKVYRYPPKRWEWGLVRGNAHGPVPEVSARAELRDELGAEPDALQRLVCIHPNSGLLAGRTQIFVARYPRPVSEPRDRNEVAAVRWETPERIREEILSGTINDGFTIAALGAALLSGVVTF